MMNILAHILGIYLLMGMLMSLAYYTAAYVFHITLFTKASLWKKTVLVACSIVIWPYAFFHSIRAVMKDPPKR